MESCSLRLTSRGAANDTAARGCDAAAVVRVRVLLTAAVAWERTGVGRHDIPRITLIDAGRTEAGTAYAPPVTETAAAWPCQPMPGEAPTVPVAIMGAETVGQTEWAETAILSRKSEFGTRGWKVSEEAEHCARHPSQHEIAGEITVAAVDIERAHASGR